MNSRAFAVAASCVLLASGLALGAIDPMTSLWRTDAMKVDGNPLDWPALTPLTKELSAGVANNADTLQLVIETSNAPLRQRLALAGLMVYVDPTNKHSEAFGLRIPPLGGRTVPGERPPDPVVTYVEIFGASKDDRHLLQLPTTNGIEAAAGTYEGSLVIEVAIPMRSSETQPFAPGLSIDKPTIEIGLVTPDPPVTRSGGGGGSGSYGGGRGGGRGGGGGGGRGYGGPPGASLADEQGKTVKLWTPVALAHK